MTLNHMPLGSHKGCRINGLGTCCYEFHQTSIVEVKNIFFEKIQKLNIVTVCSVSLSSVVNGRDDLCCNKKVAG
jgi:hypothetical protein